MVRIFFFAPKYMAKNVSFKFQSRRFPHGQSYDYILTFYILLPRNNEQRELFEGVSNDSKNIFNTQRSWNVWETTLNMLFEECHLTGNNKNNVEI